MSKIGERWFPDCQQAVKLCRGSQPLFRLSVRRNGEGKASAVSHAGKGPSRQESQDVWELSRLGPQRQI